MRMEIPVPIKPVNGQSGRHGNATAVLAEVRHALERFLATREPTLIDLNGMPFGPGDEAALLEVLGRGEVEIVLAAMGQSRLWESRYAGVWVVEHHNPCGERMAFQIEVADIPGIARSPRVGMEEALRQLSESPPPMDIAL
ncbi:hydrogenase-1 operon protein HyaF [Gammaproteobacteria bacterium]